jgi:hypothetical protein
MSKVVGVLSLLLLVTGCASMSEKKRVKMVSDRAAFDLSCDEVKLLKLSDTSYGAMGCQKKASYVLVDCDNNNWVEACKVSLDAVQQPGGTLVPVATPSAPAQK